MTTEGRIQADERRIVVAISFMNDYNRSGAGTPFPARPEAGDDEVAVAERNRSDGAFPKSRKQGRRKIVAAEIDRIEEEIPTPKASKAKPEQLVMRTDGSWVTDPQPPTPRSQLAVFPDDEEIHYASYHCP